MRLRKMNLLFGLWLALVSALSIQAQEKQATESPLLEEARQAIEKGNRQWIEGFEKGDAASVAAIFAEDGIWLGGNGKAHKGRQLLERVKGFIKYYGAGVKITVTSTAVWVDGESAFETGKYIYRYQKNGQPAVDEGRYATIWKRQKDGLWKLYLDMPVQ